MVVPGKSRNRQRSIRVRSRTVVGSRTESGEEITNICLPWTSKSGSAQVNDGRKDNGDRPRWRAATRQETGRKTEKDILRKYNARAHPNSGAGSIPFDGSNKEAIIEVKDALKSFTLKYEYLKRLRRQAAMRGLQAILVVKFPGFILECRILPNAESTD